MKNYITVTQLNSHINRILASDEILRDVWVKGEISGFKLNQSSGHAYFALKDEESIISCVMFRSRMLRLTTGVENGLEVLLRGYVALFPRQGKYQLYVEELHPFGRGELYFYLQQLKERLGSEGYFAVDKKQPLPSVVNRVGVVTSQDGAAFRDILRIIKQRHSKIDVVLVHSAVQGEQAPSEIARGIRWLNEYGQVDVIIIGRGGGSLEDLMAFNSEEVVKAIFASNIPIISAVGHEVDFSLADLAADVRAATPTQAAQIAVPELAALEQELMAYQKRILRAIVRKIEYNSEVLDRLSMKRIWKNPIKKEIREEQLARLKKDLTRCILQQIKEKQAGISYQSGKLEALDPYRPMSKGYALIKKNGQIVRQESEINVKDNLDLVFKRVSIQVEVIKKEIL
ncbi:MAG: exodeoxyribonuclease VII large subunit [Syntrophomonadaceae bacterium]|jgi:exodeoxyribonuclease VII large subunit